MADLFMSCTGSNIEPVPGTIMETFFSENPNRAFAARVSAYLNDPIER